MNKNICKIVARDIIGEKLIRGMSELDIAKDIFFHACVFFAVLPGYVVENLINSNLDANIEFPGITSLFEETVDIDFEHDGESNKVAKFVYDVVWDLL